MPPHDPNDTQATGVHTNDAMPPRGRERNRSEARPRPQSIELGVVLGTWIVPRAHELYDDGHGYAGLRAAAPVIGGRVDYFPLRWVGFEIDASVMPTKTRAGARATMWSARGGLIARGPWRVTPLATAGMGVLGVSSAPSAVGDDLDDSFHVGAGVQWFATPHVALRLDARDNLTHRRGDGGSPTHHAEIGLSVAVVLFERGHDSDDGRPSRANADTDGDKVADRFDRCPTHVGAPPLGCPLADNDRDGDGFTDRLDDCPDDFGGTPVGCPPPSDLDGDGLVEPEDRCPTVRGSSTDGCLPDAPTRPGGAVTPEVAALEGVLGDITFDHNTAKLQKSAHAKLSAIADVLAQQPGVRIELAGHTDDRGSDETNRALSHERAEAVRNALIDRGIAAERITTRGAGGDEPLATNATPQGRAINRRVELRVLPNK